jgi:hypothetical protein
MIGPTRLSALIKVESARCPSIRTPLTAIFGVLAVAALKLLAFAVGQGPSK